MDFIDKFLNKITMYRLILYYLIGLLAVAFAFSLAGILPYSPIGLAFSAVFITVVMWIVNTVFAKVFNAQTNVESVYITALILTLIITPPGGPSQSYYFSIAVWASIWAMASKYILAIKKKHVFNPAAFGVALTALTLNQPATWWVGTSIMMPFVLVGGFLMVRKILRWDLVLSFLTVAFLTIVSATLIGGQSIVTSVFGSVMESPLLFFAFVMLTEPLTTPPNKPLRIAYGALVGFLFAPQVHFGSIYLTPELALLIGNVYSYIVSSKKKLVLALEEKIKIAPGIYDFIFRSDERLDFEPGQYLEWTLGHEKPDSRGNRRYFTIASSPTERKMRLGVRFYPDPSTFKKNLLSMGRGDEIIASQLAGDFVLPRDKRKKLVLIAGGIGITPIRSMVKYLLDKNERRSIVVFYSNKTSDEIMYRDVFDEAEEKLGIRTVYSLTGDIPDGWEGESSRVNERMIKKYVPDWRERTFYVSGTHSMVVSLKETLEDMGVEKKSLKTDFFPGFA